MDSKIFSIPFCNEMPPQKVEEEYIPFLKEYKEYLYDIYFTAIIPPFGDDAMGAALGVKDPYKETIKTFQLMMRIQEETGITVSATFNNIKTDPTAKNLQIFMRGVRSLYGAGLRSMTVPHYHWLLSGELKREFPQMSIKNTILRNVSRPQNYVDYAQAGFDVINIDRHNLRNHDNLKALKKAYDKYKVPMQILVNEGCRGNCPAMDEHFELNCSDRDNGLYFEQELAQYTCNRWKGMNPAYRLQSGIMPPHREDFEEILEYVQILKLHGRTVLHSLEGSMEIVRRYADQTQAMIMPGLGEQIEHFGYDDQKLKQWRACIKNCKFECWDCSMCGDLHSSASNYALEF